jgi:sulfonate transport system permease protein
VTTAAAGRRDASGVLLTLLGSVLLLAVWTVGGRAGWARGMVVTPLEAVGPLRDDRAREVYLRALRATAGAAGRGLIIGAVLGVAAAMVASVIPATRRVVTRLAALSNATPWVVVGPILLIVLGRSRGPVGLAAIAALFPMFVSTYLGLVSTPPGGLDVARAHGASRAVELRAVRIPAAVPATIDGLRLAGPAALAGAIFGEWYGAERGIGVLLVSAMQNARADRLWAASLLAVALAAALYGLLGLLAGWVDRRFGPASTATALPRRPFSARRLVVDAAGSFVFTVVLVVIWWGWIEIRHVSPLVLPRPSRVADDIVGHAGSYAVSAAHTLATAGIALVIGSVIGVLAAVLSATSRVIAGLSTPVVVGLAATPLVAVFPLLARVFGYGPATVRALAAVMVFFPVFVHTRAGLLSTPPGARDVVDSFGAGRWNAFSRVVFMAAVPRMATGLRLAVASSVVAAVVGESLIGRQGLGVDFTYAYNLNHPASAFGAAVVIVVVSLVVFALATAGEAFLHARWN